MKTIDKTAEKYQQILNEYWDKEGGWLEYCQSRWEDESKYENPEEYKKVIIKRAKKHNININKISLSYKTLSLKIQIKFDDIYTGTIKITTKKIHLYITKGDN